MKHKIFNYWPLLKMVSLGIFLTLLYPVSLIALDEDKIVIPRSADNSSLTDTVVGGSPSSGAFVAYMLLFLVAGIGLFIYLRKGFHKNSLKGSAGGIRITDTKALGNRQYLAVVECDDQRMLIGMGPGFINHLCFLETTRVSEDELLSLPDEQDSKQNR
jgi:flagellar biogenesis protein FliO